MTKGKTIPIQKDSKKKQPQPLQTNNVPTDDVENTIGTNKRGDLLFAVEAVDSSPKNKKDVSRKQLEQEINDTLMNK